MPGFNFTVSAAPGTAYADAGVTAARDYNVQNLGAGVVEYTTAVSQPASSFRGLQLERSEMHPIKVPSGERLLVRLGPAVTVPSSVLSGVEVP